MKALRTIATAACVVAAVVANAGKQVPLDSKDSAELQLLQGTWEGAQVGSKAKITMTITGTSLHFHRDTNFWFKTTILLPPGKNPDQLHATINDCPASQADSIGELVKAFFKIEDGTLTLATMGEDTKETLEAFSSAGTRYEFLKV